MLLKQISGKSCRDLLIAIERDVQSEIDTGHSGNGAHVVVDRISLRHAPGGIGMPDTYRVVKFHHRFEAG